MGMKLGWAVVSDKDIRAAANSLHSPGDGVVDEVGVRVLHSLYADRFFPGVSVQQRRLRYVVLVPWLFSKLASKPMRDRDAKRALQQAEVKLAELLVDGKETLGVVGGTQVGRPVKLPPSSTYMGLLVQLGMIPNHPVHKRPFTLAEMLKHWPDRAGKAIMDEEGRRVDEAAPLPDAGVPMPADFLEGATNLTLRLVERDEVSRRLQGICTFGEMGRGISLLGRLASQTTPIDPQLLFRLEGAEARKAAADARLEDSAVLERAAQAASLGAVVRAVYAALVETECEAADHRSIGAEHRDALPGIVATHGRVAKRLDLSLVRNDAHSRSGSYRALAPKHYIRTLFDETVRALVDDSLGTPSGLAMLKPAYQTAETKRKRGLARLPPSGAARRGVWNPDDHGKATPLHYRSWVVAQFLNDLQAASG